MYKEYRIIIKNSQCHCNIHTGWNKSIKLFNWTMYEKMFNLTI
jgi:hypothetical protein